MKTRGNTLRDVLEMMGSFLTQDKADQHCLVSTWISFPSAANSLLIHGVWETLPLLDGHNVHVLHRG